MTTDKILVVDDDPSILDLFQRNLGRCGIAADYFDSSLEALGMFVPGQYRLAVLDLMMPALNGHELAKQLLDQDPALVVVLYTGLETEGEEAIVVVPKSRPISEVAEMVARMLRREAAA